MSAQAADYSVTRRGAARTAQQAQREKGEARKAKEREKEERKKLERGEKDRDNARRRSEEAGKRRDVLQAHGKSVRETERQEQEQLEREAREKEAREEKLRARERTMMEEVRKTQQPRIGKQRENGFKQSQQACNPESLHPSAFQVPQKPSRQQRIQEWAEGGRRRFAAEEQKRLETHRLLQQLLMQPRLEQQTKRRA